MATIPKSPETSTSGKPSGYEHSRFSLDKLRTGVYTALAIAALTLLATAEEDRAKKPDRMPTNNIAVMSDGRTTSSSVELGLSPITPDEAIKLPSIILKTGEKQPNTELDEITKKIIDTQRMEWAPDFLTGPESTQQIGIDKIHEAISIIKDLEAKGYTVSITMEGKSSDEGDDREDDNPGFGLKPNKKNIILANGRARAEYKRFIQQIEEESGQEEAKRIKKLVTILDGEEVRDDDFAKRSHALAHKLNMRWDALIMQFNRDPKSLPIYVQKELFELTEDRGVEIIIHAERKVIIEGNEKTEKIIGIPFIIPIFRKRKKTQPPKTSKPPQNFPIPQDDDRKFNLPTSRVIEPIFQPDTGNAHYGKGSGGRVATSRGTSHRGQKH